MANEHTLWIRKTFPVSYTCANANGIEKGTLLKLADPSTVSAQSANLDPCIGVAYTEKIANDGNTTIAVLSGPGDELKAVASGSVTAGDALYATLPANYLASAKTVSEAGLSGSTIVGISLETASAGETFRYMLQITKYGGLAA